MPSACRAPHPTAESVFEPVDEEGPDREQPHHCEQNDGANDHAQAGAFPARRQQRHARKRKQKQRNWKAGEGKPTVFERTKNISASSSSPRNASCFLHWEDKDRAVFAPLLHLLHQPAFEQFVLNPFIARRNRLDPLDNHGAVVIGDDDVVREDRAAAAPDRLVPADKCQLVHRGRRSNARTPDRRPVASTPCLSRITPSVTSAVTPRLTMRMHRISPNMPAPVTPIASATTTQFSGMASMAPRVGIGFDQLSGVARSSRTGTRNGA